jgi:hypothetical protein
MTEEEFENWQMVQYRMDNEGIDYCFEHYLRLEFLENMKKIRKYVEDKIDSYEEEY